MIIKVKRTGGLTGINVLNEMDTKDLPSALIDTAKKVMSDQNLSSITMKSTPRGAADYYSYKIWLQDGSKGRVIECNEHDIRDDLKSLVRYVERNSRRAKRDET
jgi:hypothetical protein